MKYAVMLALIVSSCPSVHAAESLPPRFAGTWTTETVPNGAPNRQIDLYLAADGSGDLLGSVRTPTKPRNPDGTYDADLIFDMRIETSLNGDVLTTRPSVSEKQNAEEAARITLTCQYDPDGPALLCTDPRGVMLNLQRRSETMTAEVAKKLAVVRSHTPQQ